MKNNIGDVVHFIKAHPTAWEREILINFETMERAVMKIDLKPYYL